MAQESNLSQRLIYDDIWRKCPQDYEILGWCPARPLLPNGEKVPL